MRSSLTPASELAEEKGAEIAELGAEASLELAGQPGLAEEGILHHLVHPRWELPRTQQDYLELACLGWGREGLNQATDELGIKRGADQKTLLQTHKNEEDLQASMHSYAQ
ncbi:unnamed protein product [Protopolystoma xenopodis]|uniref:Uncharacterized protein n=1 Tax=Protopolystoma xenopodis TaxID=117903 RepID=A0A448WQW0_9PLAT|nr:unnamed protein product [Protopolystoma xenopodis]